PLPLLVLGGGSNVILPAHFPGLVIHMQNQGFVVEGDQVRAQSGQNWHQLVAACCQQGRYGLENLALIPGSVGAAPIQNIGAYGVELKDIFISLKCIRIDSGEWETLSLQDCQFAYRESVFKNPASPRRLISEVSLKLSREPKLTLAYPGLQQQLAEQGLEPAAVSPQQVFNAVCSLRQSKLPDPAELANVGSFFKNPVIDAAQHRILKQRYPDLVSYPAGADFKLAAGWLIDKAGWKGERRGPVGVHNKQALVLVNHGGASSAQLMQLAGAIEADIREKFGISLEREPRLIDAEVGRA
ncbi:MAG: UDP-N-acetylmuramate dehydrogenase, partial [Cellvibrionaceae bacterium]|nr:UDP-N-acetylmuramate dehydrogenase [Cellvibrionaceae bacterium]